MSAASCLLSEDELQCSICLEVLTDPVSTPCGHNFCQRCLLRHWDSSAVCDCPLCKERFLVRPKLKPNTFISAMVAQFRRGAPLRSAEAGARLRPEPRCPQHDEPLKMFCESDRTVVCGVCAAFTHKSHRVVLFREAYDNTQRELKKTSSEVQKMIQECLQKIREIQESLEVLQTAADEEAIEGVQFFSALTDFVQKGLEKVLQEMEEKQNKAKTKAEALIQALEQEVSELKQRSSEIEQLRRSTDHLHVLKTCSSLPSAPLRDCADVRVRAPCSLPWAVPRAVQRIEAKITEELQLFSKRQQTKVREFAVEVTLDPDTAHPELRLSEDLKQVTHTGVRRNLTDNPQRCTAFPGVLGKESFSSGRAYFEVKVKGNHEWVVGVARVSIDRKRAVSATPAHGYWILQLFRGLEYGTADPEYAPLTLRSRPRRVGVFVDYEEGVVCFYDVDTAALIHGFTRCSFTDKLHPYFYTDSVETRTSAPLVIARATNGFEV